MTHPDAAKTSARSASYDRSIEPNRDGAPIRPDHLTVSAAIALLTISVLHTAVFALHPWWGAWMAGPFRTSQVPAPRLAVVPCEVMSAF